MVLFWMILCRPRFSCVADTYLPWTRSCSLPAPNLGALIWCCIDNFDVLQGCGCLEVLVLHDSCTIRLLQIVWSMSLITIRKRRSTILRNSFTTLLVNVDNIIEGNIVRIMFCSSLLLFRTFNKLRTLIGHYFLLVYKRVSACVHSLFFMTFLYASKPSHTAP